MALLHRQYDVMLRLSLFRVMLRQIMFRARTKYSSQQLEVIAAATDWLKSDSSNDKQHNCLQQHAKILLLVTKR
jgi:environmental stress-induced protein Ves